MMITIAAPISCACRAFVTNGQSPLGMSKKEFSALTKNQPKSLEYYSVGSVMHSVLSPGDSRRFAIMVLPKLYAIDDRTEQTQNWQ